jgi:hypothetical protein
MKERSIFGPLLLIATGVVWLLVSMNIIPGQNLWALTYIWPYVLIALGVGLLLSAWWAGAGRVMSVLVILGAVAAIVFAPQLGWARSNWNFDFDFGGGIPGSGNVKTEIREVAEFSVISIEYPAQIVVLQGDSPSVKVEAEDNLLPQLRTEVRGGVLQIESRERDWSRRAEPSEPVRITITVDDLQELRFSSAGTLRIKDLEVDELKLVLSGAGEVTIDNVTVGEFETVLSGAGDIKATGAVDGLKLTISGFGNFDAPELTSLIADVRITGAGNATIRVEQDLSATVSGAGSIDYYGSPSVDKTITGAGSVNNAGD